MEPAGERRGLLDDDPGQDAPLLGDRRTGRAFRATVRGSSGPRRWCARGSRPVPRRRMPTAGLTRSAAATNPSPAEPPRGTRAAWPRAFAYLAHRVRQVIEVVNAQLQGQFAIERTLAKTLWGLVTRIQAKLTAHTLGVYLNVLAGQPPLALKTLVV